MKFIKIYLILVLLMVFQTLKAQKIVADSSDIDRLNKIYSDLQYNTIAFNDLRNKWYVTDPIYVREIYNRFVVNNSLTVDGKKASKKLILEKTQDVYNGDVFIELKKRYYDNEIDTLRFFTESKLNKIDSTNNTYKKKDYFFDPITDYVYIQKVLGKSIYDDLKARYYAYTDLTKEPFGVKQAYNFDIYLNLMNSYLMFWSATTSLHNKYTISFFTKWGNDYFNFPGWFYPDVFAGFRVSYINYLKNNEKYITYSLEMGYSLPARQPVLDFNRDAFGPRLFHSGTMLYLRLFGNPLHLITPKLDKLEISLGGAFSITQYKTNQFNVDYISQFYSNRNFFFLSARYKDIFPVLNLGWFYAGGAIASYDIYHFLLDPRVSKLIPLNNSSKGNFEHVLTVMGGISANNSLLVHDISLMLSYNVVKSFAYIGIKTHFMLNNQIGLDFEYMTSFLSGKGGLPFYKKDTYIVFSPIIKINY